MATDTSVGMDTESSAGAETSTGNGTVGAGTSDDASTTANVDLSICENYASWALECNDSKNYESLYDDCIVSLTVSEQFDEACVELTAMLYLCLTENECVSLDGLPPEACLDLWNQTDPVCYGFEPDTDG